MLLRNIWISEHLVVLGGSAVAHHVSVQASAGPARLVETVLALQAC